MCIVPGMTSRVLAGGPPGVAAVRRPARPRRGRAPAQKLANLPVRRRIRPVASRPRPGRVTLAAQTGGMASPAQHACVRGFVHSSAQTGRMDSQGRSGQAGGTIGGTVAARLLCSAGVMAGETRPEHVGAFRSKPEHAGRLSNQRPGHVFGLGLKRRRGVPVAPRSRRVRTMERPCSPACSEWGACRRTLRLARPRQVARNALGTPRQQGGGCGRQRETPGAGSRSRSSSDRKEPFPEEWFRMVRPGDRRSYNAGAEVQRVLLILGGGAVARV